MITKQNNHYISPIHQPKFVKLTRKSQLNEIIVNEDGSPDYLGINIYWDSFRSWYNPKTTYTKDGNVLHLQKLKTPGVFSNYTTLAKLHGCSKETIRRKIVKQEQLGLIQRDFQHRSTITTDSYNRLIVYVWKETPHFFNELGVNRSKKTDLTPYTNHKYIEEKHGVTFGLHHQSNKGVLSGGGIHTRVDTKELNNILISRDIRSNALMSESNFNNDLILEDSKESNEIVSFEDTKKASIHVLKSSRPSNKRKKRTKAEIKAKKAKVFVFRQYSKKKDLAAHYPLTSEDCTRLQVLSGRDFTLNAMNEILLDMSKRVGSLFSSKAQFMAYMAKVFENEKRDAVKTANTGFKIKANQSKETREDLESEKFLSKIEQQAIDHVCPENQLKAKLAGTLSLKAAYKLLLRAKSFDLSGKVMNIYLNASVTLTEGEKGVVLSQVRAVYGDVDDLEFVTDGAGEFSSDVSDIQEHKPDALDLPEGIWGDISQKLIDKYGVDIYKSWFAKLRVSVDNDAKTIKLNTSSNMVYDWITSKYGMFLNHILANMGIELRILN